MTLNGVMAVIVRYFTEFGSFRGPLGSDILVLQIILVLVFILFSSQNFYFI